MGTLHPHPLLRGAVDHGFHLVVGRGPLALLHDSQVDGVLQDTAHRHSRPQGLGVYLVARAVFDPAGALVLHGREDAQAVEPVRDGLAALAGDAPGEDVPHMAGGLLIHHQMVFVLRVLAVSVGRPGADELAVAPLDIEMAAYLDGGVPAVGVVDKIFHRDDKTGGGVGVQGVDVLHNGDQPHAHGGEHFLHITPALDGLPAEAGQILDDNAVDLFGFDGLDHLLEMGPVKVGPGIAVVIALHNQLQFRPVRNELVDEIPLVFDAVALIPDAGPLIVLPGEASIPITIKKFHKKPPRCIPQTR